MIEQRRAAGLAYREALPEGEGSSPPVLCIHGFPETSFMWRDVMPAVAAGGNRVLAPDMPGSGDSPADPPNTWERLVEAFERFVVELDLDRSSSSFTTGAGRSARAGRASTPSAWLLW